MTKLVTTYEKISLSVSKALAHPVALPLVACIGTAWVLYFGAHTIVEILSVGLLILMQRSNNVHADAMQLKLDTLLAKFGETDAVGVDIRLTDEEVENLQQNLIEETCSMNVNENEKQSTIVPSELTTAETKESKAQVEAEKTAADKSLAELINKNKQERGVNDSEAETTR